MTAPLTEAGRAELLAQVSFLSLGLEIQYDKICRLRESNANLIAAAEDSAP